MKLALLGPIAWRTPPRHYGPWELVTGLLAEGLVAARRRRDAVRHAGLDHARATLDGVCARPYEEDGEIDGRVWEALHVAHALSRSAEFDLIHNHLDWLPLAFSRLARAPMVTTIHGFSSPRILPAYLRSDSALRLDLRRRPRPRARLRGDGPPRRRRDARCRSRATAGDALVCFGRIHPDKGTARGDRDRPRRRSAARALRPGAGRALLRRARSSRTSTATRVRYLGSVGARERGRGAGRGRLPAAPDRVRRAVRALGRRVDAVRHAGRRLRPRVDARARSTTASPACSRDGVDSAVAGVRARRCASTAPRAASAAERRFSADRMVDDYLDVYESVLRDR